jgi:type I restriction enzyme M protein
MTHAASNSIRHERKESERFKSFTYDELMKRDKVNFDIFWRKPLEESANLPAPEIIAQEPRMIWKSPWSSSPPSRRI